jgi:hypothetical protein
MPNSVCKGWDVYTFKMVCSVNGNTTWWQDKSLAFYRQQGVIKCWQQCHYSRIDTKIKYDISTQIYSNPNLWVMKFLHAILMWVTTESTNQTCVKHMAWTSQQPPKLTIGGMKIMSTSLTNPVMSIGVCLYVCANQICIKFCTMALLLEACMHLYNNFRTNL